MNSNRLFITLISLMFFVCITITPSAACEPVPQLMMLFFGPDLWGLMTIVGLFVVVLLKCILFAKWSGLSKSTAFSSMFAANIYSTIPGLLGGVFMAVPAMLIPSGFLPILIILYFPSKCIAANFKIKGINTISVLVLFSIAIVMSTFFFSASQNVMLESSAAYWLMKVVYSTLAVSIGLGITIGFEYSAIAVLVRKKHANIANLFPVVARTNLYAMLIAVGIAALAMLPQRLASPDFLVFLQNSIRLVCEYKVKGAFLVQVA